MGAIGWVLIAVIALQPLLSWWRWRRVRPRLEEPGVRLALYWRAMALAWTWTALVALGAWRHGWSAARLGLTLPPAAGAPSWLATAGLAAFTLVVLVLPVATATRRAELSRAFREASAILPRTRGERVSFVLLALTAGFCEELLHRGFLIAFVTAEWPGLPRLAVVAAASLPFGLAHAYQGVRGVVMTTLLGAAFAGLYLSYQSLWIPIALHALVDLRAALLRPATPSLRAGDRAPA